MTSRSMWNERRRGAALRAGTLAALALTCAGCAYRSQATGMAVDYNEFVAQATNRQTVLNILRASKREPMHFTSFSEVVGTIRGGGSLGTGLAINDRSVVETTTESKVANTDAGGLGTGGSTTNQVVEAVTRGVTDATPSLELTVATGTDFKIAANATDEFYKGILNPIPAATVVNYLRQGFPSDLLSHLVVGRLEFWAKIQGPNGYSRMEQLTTFNNNPDEPNISHFADAISCRKLDYSATPAPAATIEADDLASFGELTPEQLGRVRSRRATDGKLSYSLTIPERTDFDLALSEREDGKCRTTQVRLEDRFRAVRTGLGLPAPSRPSTGGPQKGRLLQPTPSSGDAARRDDIAATRVRLDSKGYFNPLLAPEYQGDLVIDITLRSVEGVIYYLGEYIRTDTPPVLLDGGRHCPGQCLPILRVRPVEEVPGDSRFTRVDYRGRQYAVPLSEAKLTTDAGRSSQAISLVQQLLNLNRSSKDLPATPLVRVYN